MAILLSLWYAWRYSKIDIDPDWAAFNLSGFTGARYGYDFVDCKTPVIHWWYWTLSKIVGRNVARVKFAHHVLISLPALAMEPWAGLAYVILINSGWLYGFHGNIGQLASAFVVLALLVQEPWVACGLMVLSLLVEPKLIFAFIPMVVIKGWYVPTLLYGVMGMVAATAIRLANPEYWNILWESNITIPKRMVQNRKWVGIPWYTGTWLLYLAPWVVVGVSSKPDLLYWLPALLVLLGQWMGKVVKPTHALLLVPWIALVFDWRLAVGLFIVEAVSSGLYFGDIWYRFYYGIRDINKAARQAGLWLKDKKGVVFVNNFHVGVYIYAQKKPPYGIVPLLELWLAASERRCDAVKQFKENLPEWIVVNPVRGAIPIISTIHRKVKVFDELEIYRRGK